MFWKRLFERVRGRLSPGEEARLLHSLWLTEALRSGREYPRIPLRPVAQGGFETMMSRPGGAARAEQWWRAAMDKVE